MKTYRIVIVGTGGIAQSHIDAAHYTKDRVQVVAVCDIDAERVEAFRAQHGLPKAYTDYTVMFREEKPDFVLICTPPSLHTQISIAAMEAGAWVMCEKPLCASLAELYQIQEAETRTGCTAPNTASARAVNSRNGRIRVSMKLSRNMAARLRL